MPRIKWSFEKFPGTGLSTLAALVISAACFPARSVAQQPGQKTFSSPEAATAALVMAEKNSDEKAMLVIFGAEGKRLVFSGDETEDASDRANFVDKYDQMHRLMKEPDGTTTLYIGAENWPLPIPLTKKDNMWYFDTEASKREVMYRRVGRNELSTIRVCQELVAAEKEYYGSQNSEYAQQIFSDPGKRNGLYWKAAAGETQSPIGPLVASAAAKGYATPKSDESAAPYMGYYYMILTRQGANAPGGAKSYVVDGKMTGGFAFVAYPAEYRSSGVMTFAVGPDGVVLQKDLGKQTAALVEAMKEYNPNSTWQKANNQGEESTAETQAK